MKNTIKDIRNEFVSGAKFSVSWTLSTIAGLTALNKAPDPYQVPAAFAAAIATLLICFNTFDKKQKRSKNETKP